MHRHPSFHPNLEFYRKQAKALLRELRAGSDEAAARVRQVGKRGQLSLSDTQRIVAREHGYASWRALRLASQAAAEPAPVAAARAALPQRQPAAPDAPRSAGRAASLALARPVSLPEAAPGASRHAQARHTREHKQRYGGDADVRRWLRSAPDAAELPDQRGVPAHERDWVLSALQPLAATGHVSGVLGVVKAGKEATVYRCAAAVGGYLAAKVYRPRMFRNLKNDALYRSQRAPCADRRAARAMDAMSRRGRALRMQSWIEFEFATHQRVHAAGGCVPAPVAQHGSALLMQYFGTADHGASPLRHVALSQSAARRAFDQLLSEVELMLQCDVVHGDLSAFNVLYWDEMPIIIDFAQAVDAQVGASAAALLRRDVARLVQHFSRYGVEADAVALADDMWARHNCRR